MHNLKIIIFIIVMLVFAFLYFPLLILFYPWHIDLGPKLLQFASKIILRIFSVKIEHSDKIDRFLSKKKGFIIISNHVSLLDIFLLSALYGTIFVSKIEVRHYPVFGQIAALMGVIFLKRDSPEERHLIIRELAEKSRDRIITIFPQGTTSSLSLPLPFKCGIFKTVEMNNELFLVPVTIHYKEDKDIAWTGDQLLLENVKMVCRQKRIHVRVNIHKLITNTDFKNNSITEVCKKTEKVILGN
jgi:1-acyl-sn-glycerol-3-phosphate acyltransferase